MTWVFSWKINLYPNSEPYFVMAMNINERIQMPIKLLCGALVLLAFSDLAACGEREIERDTCPRQAQQFARIQDQGQRKDARAQTALASCYELGMHVKPSRQQAIHWLKLAAEQGYAPAQYELGRIYLFGRGVPPDYSQALLWTGKAACKARLMHSGTWLSSSNGAWAFRPIRQKLPIGIEKLRSRAMLRRN